MWQYLFKSRRGNTSKGIIIGRFVKELNSKISSQWQKKKKKACNCICLTIYFLEQTCKCPWSIQHYQVSLALSGGVSMGSIGGTFSWTKHWRLGSHVGILHLDGISLRSNSDLYYRNRKWLLVFSLSLAPLLSISVNVSEQICILKISWN